MAVLAGSMYRRAGCGVDARGVPDVTGCLFIICARRRTSALFSSFFPCIGLIGKSMPLAYRESAGGLYEISAHLVAYVITDAPVQVFLAAANMAIVYVMVDPRCGKGSGDDRAHFLAFLLVAQLVAYAGAGLGYCLPAVLPVEVALIVAPVVVYPCILFGGLYERSVDIPWYFAWWNSAVLEFYGLGNLSFSASCWSLLAVGTGLRVFVFAYLELHAAWAKRG
ncbi:ATPase [Aureococcus anophagefferens]|nr:ATPase [Aureococcus anophagefferens]